MDVRLDGKIMLVTGASLGIGRAIAALAAESGARVAANYYNSADEAESLVDEVKNKGGECIAVRADVSKEDEVALMFDEVKGHYGDAPDILVNNAGSMIKRSPISEMDVSVWDRVMEVNLRSVFLASRLALASMIPKGQGVIINITSIAAYTGGGPGSGAYAATKGAMNTMTVGMAKEAAPHNVRVVGVGPGVIDTPFHDKFTTAERREKFEDMIPLGRVGLPEDIAPLVIFLASEYASFATGHCFYVTGGM